MIITCESNTRMGYIYLMPNYRIMNIYENENNDINKYVDMKSINIKVNETLMHINQLKQMRISEYLYRDVSYKGKEFTEEYHNDLDENGYMIGIELNLSKEKFLRLIKNKSFQIYQLNWMKSNFILLTLDIFDNVFDSNNILYPFSERKDVFAIVQIEGKYNTGLIKGILSSRDDLYPIEYLRRPEFILWDN